MKKIFKFTTVVIVIASIMVFALIGSIFRFKMEDGSFEPELPRPVTYTAYFYDTDGELIYSETYRDNEAVVFPTKWKNLNGRVVYGWKVNDNHRCITSYTISGADVAFYAVISDGFEGEWDVFVEFDQSWLDDEWYTIVEDDHWSHQR